MECTRLERYDENLEPVFRPKLKFETLELAIEHAKKVNSLDHVIHKVVAYKCRKCYKYHVGRNGKELTEKERAKFKKPQQIK